MIGILDRSYLIYRPLSIRRAFILAYLGINSMWKSISEKRQCSAKYKTHKGSPRSFKSHAVYVSRYLKKKCFWVVLLYAHRERTLHPRIHTAVHTCVEHNTAVNAGNDHKVA